jgi:hypothetical protein
MRLKIAPTINENATMLLTSLTVAAMMRTFDLVTM